MTEHCWNQIRLALLIIPTLWAASCSKHPPLETFGAAKLAVEESENDQAAARYAPAEVQNAPRKLAEAKDAMDDEDYVRARRMSEQAIVDAQLASAKARAAESNIDAAREEQNTQIIQNQLNP